MQEILDFLQSLDWSPLVISIKTGIVATILSFFFGIFAACGDEAASRRACRN